MAAVLAMDYRRFKRGEMLKVNERFNTAAFKKRAKWEAIELTMQLETIKPLGKV